MMITHNQVTHTVLANKSKGMMARSRVSKLTSQIECSETIDCTFSYSMLGNVITDIKIDNSSCKRRSIITKLIINN